ncbi:sialate O-acetylesterase [Siphonobacter sp. SORGH_AS_1065]|uniref:sialate O-acetylesterase n=1 Tax=Siphonobacter sp. SORGH_AS_1065 TaxID=3041795 RepID=UPI002780F5A8|nr:sialate O-acetylesterase [Siphonobacter sp. SORGH_AS_1065]MDQ1085568.1 sialate O-acetylesterase [Siphonobacter sp. SORGH_AS_1065]
MKKSAFLFYFLVLIGFSLSAQVRLPKFISDGMILQRDTPLTIWGWANPGEKVTVRFQNKTYKTTTSSNRKWQISLPALPAGGPFQMEIAGSNRITIQDILLGDVWFCSGQSNMVHQLNIHDVTYAQEIKTANYPQIRQFWVPTLTNLESPQAELPQGQWKAAVGEDVRPFSAVAYFFAKTLHEKYKVPIGIINASVGGTPIEAWMSEEGLRNFPDAVATLQKNKDTAYVQSLMRRVTTPQAPTDAGLEASPKWYEVNDSSKGWRPINVPGYWEDQGVKDLNGIVWYLRELELPATMVGKAAKVFLGRIVDADELYINGILIAKTAYQYPQRRYPVPANILKAGKNTIVVRVTNTGGKGGFVPDKPYCLFAGTDTVDLKGTWQYNVGSVFKPQPRGEFQGGLNAQNQPTALFNAMVAPFIPYAIKGFCWYQGESNAGQPQAYAQLLPALIQDWRRLWQQESLPFLYVQLPGYMDYQYLPGESNWALMREAQLKALSVPNTAMAVAIDLGEWNDIHPDNKKDVGERLARTALKTVYHENIVASGPLFQSTTIQGNKIKLSFTNVGSGLQAIDGEPLGDFAIAGSDKKFVWAQARIEGDQVVVWSDEVPNPQYVRYAWADNPVHANLYNKEGLPASPFRTDQ